MHKSKVKPEAQTYFKHPFIPCPKQPLQFNGQDLVNFFVFLMENFNSLLTMYGFPFLSNPNFLQESATLAKNYYHVGMVDFIGGGHLRWYTKLSWCDQL